MKTADANRFPLARAIATAAVGGAILLIALDFARGDATTETDPGKELIERRLKSVANLDLFTTVDVPGGDLKVVTGMEYADARSLADGRIGSRWCYVERTRKASSFSARIDLGRQNGDDAPVFSVSGVAPDQARQLGLSADALASLAQSNCRFAG